MSFNYHKNKESAAGETFWTSYADLFLGLSTIFLLLYVVSSLRTGTDGIKNMIENQRLNMQVQDLKNQLKMYESIKTDYLNKEASKGEQQEYTELMDKLTLLQEEAKDESERLKREALENQSKGVALNKYQQMIRNIINANKMAKTKIINRDDVIEQQDEEIDVKDLQIGDLEKNIRKQQNLISQNEKQIRDADKALQKQMADLERARKQNRLTAKAYQKKMADLKEERQNEIDQLRDAGEGYQKQLKASQAQLNNLTGQLEETSGKLEETTGKLAQKTGEAESLKGQLSDTKGQLAKAQAEMDARKAVARDIKKGFAAAGIKADIDMQTGDVFLDFGEAYFERDSSAMKPEMKNVLEKAMPVYSKSLFGNPKLADKISAVEVVGFASPTYKSRYIDPNSNRPEDKEAIKYNMDLSYRRAKAIFNHILDERTMQFQYQKEMVPMMKVSGRSFLEVMKNNKVKSGQDFCKVNDCKKAQRVIIKFSMDGKK